jgi:hypothetical protein
LRTRRLLSMVIFNPRIQLAAVSPSASVRRGEPTNIARRGPFINAGLLGRAYKHAARASGLFSEFEPKFTRSRVVLLSATHDEHAGPGSGAAPNGSTIVSDFSTRGNRVMRRQFR